MALVVQFREAPCLAILPKDGRRALVVLIEGSGRYGPDPPCAVGRVLLMMCYMYTLAMQRGRS